MNNNSVTPSKNVSFKRMDTKDQSNQKENFDTDLEQLQQQPLGHEAFVKIGDIVILKFKNSSSTQEGFIQGDGIIQTKLDLVYSSEQLNGEMKINDVLRKNLKIQQCLFKIKVGKKYQVQGQSKSKEQIKSKKSQKGKQQKQNLSKSPKRPSIFDCFKQQPLQIYPIDSSDDSDESYDNQQGEQTNDINKITAKLQEMEEVLENHDGSILTYGQEVQFYHLYSGSTLTINREAITQKEASDKIVLSNQGSIHSNFQIFQSIARNQGNPIFYGQQLVIQPSTAPTYYLNIQESFAFSGFEEVSANSKPSYFSFQNYEQVHHQNRPIQEINFIKEKKFQNGDVIYIKNKGSQSYLYVGKKKFYGSLEEVNKIIQKQIDFQKIYELKVEQQEEDINLKGLWLIEDVDFQQHHVFTTQTSFTLKHLLTGLYLKVDYRNEKQNLGFSITNEKATCIFNFLCQFQARALITDQDVFQIIHKNKKQNENQQDFVMLVENQSLLMKEISSDQDYGKYLFCFEISNKQDCRSVTTLNTIYFSLVNLLFLLQKEEINFSKQLKQQLSVALTQITSFLNEEQNVWTDREMKQRYILKADILMLIIVILNMLLSLSSKQLDSAAIVESIVEISQMLKGVFSNNSNVCEFILSKQLEKESPFYFLKSFFNNRNFPSDILQNVVFYSEQFPQDFFQLMISFLDQINEQNIHFQINIFKVLPLIMINRNEKSRFELQNKSLKYLQDNQKLFFKLDFKDELLFFEFCLPSTNIQFEKNNPQLFKYFKLLEQINNQKQINQGRIYLKFFMESHKLDEEQSKLVDMYEDYFASVLSFYSSLFQSRNKQAIKQISEQFNLTTQNILSGLKYCQNYSAKLKLKLQSAFINLLVNLYLNVENISEKSSLLINIYDDILNSEPFCSQEIHDVPPEDLIEFFYNYLNLIHSFCNIKSNQEISVVIKLFQGFLNIMTKEQLQLQTPDYLIQQSLLNMKNSIFPDKIMNKILLIFKIVKIRAISPDKEINTLLYSYLISTPQYQNPYFNEMKSLLLTQKSNLDNKQNIVETDYNFQNNIILTFNGEQNLISLSIIDAKKLIPKTIIFIRKQQQSQKDQKTYEQEFLGMSKYINQLLCYFEQEQEKLLDKQIIFYKMGGLQILNDIFIDLNQIREDKKDILVMYDNLIAIYYYLTKNNLIIGQGLSNINYAATLLSFLYINLDNRIAIHKVFSNILYTTEFQQESIELIFKHVKQIGAQLLMKHSFFQQYSQNQSSNQKSSQEYFNYPCHILIKAAIECVKILSAIAKAIVPNKYRYLQRQEFIIQKILSSNFFCIAMTSQNYFTQQNDSIRTKENVEHHLIDLHNNILYLSCYCFQNNSSQAALELNKLIQIEHIFFQLNNFVSVDMMKTYFKYTFTQLQNNKTQFERCYILLSQLLEKEFQTLKYLGTIFQECFIEQFFSKQGIFSMFISCLSFFSMNNENNYKFQLMCILIDKFLNQFSIYKKEISEDIQEDYLNLLNLHRSMYENLKANFHFSKHQQHLIYFENHFQAQLIYYEIDFEQFCFFYFAESQMDLTNFCSQLCNFQFNFNEVTQKQLVKYIEQSPQFYFFRKQLEQEKKQIAASQLQFLQAHEDKSQFFQIIQLFKNDKQFILSTLSQQEELEKCYLQHQSEKLQFKKELKQSLNSFLINSKNMDIQFLHKVFQYYNQHKSFELQANIGGFIRNNSSIQQDFIQLIRQLLISSQQESWKEIMKFISKLCNANKEFQDLFRIGQEAISIQNIIINKLSLFLTIYQEQKFYLREIIGGLIALQKLAARNSTICQEICQNQLFMDQLNKILSFQDMKIDEFYVQFVYFVCSEFTLIFQIVELFIVLINIEQPFQNIIYILSYVQNLRKLFKVFFQLRKDLDYPDVVFVDERFKEFKFNIIDQPEKMMEIDKLYSNLYTLFSYLKHHLNSMSIEQDLSKLNINYFPSNWQSIKQCILYQITDIEDNMQQAVFQIEILNENQKLETQFFPRLEYSNYLTIRIKQHILTNVERSNQYKRIQGLIKNFDIYSQQMQFLKYISKYKLMYLGLRNWRIFKKITYFFYLLVVILFVALYNEQQSVSLEQNLSNQLSESNLNEFYYIINSLILFLNCIIFGFSFIERNKILVADYKLYREQREQQIQYQKFNTKIDFYFSDFNVAIFYFMSRINNCFVELLPLIFNFENLYNILIISLVIYGYFNQYIYGILLLDIVSQSDDLQLIIQSVTLNGMNILRFAYLAVVGLLIYSFIAYSYFKSMFENENGIYAGTLFQTITSTINQGLRSGGGIGDALGNYHNPNEDPTNYWSRYIYDVSFFIIFNMLFFQMLFGMIIETFGELRAEQQRIKQEINEKCVLCGISQDDADKYESNGWFYHIYVKHNLYNMLFYMMHIKNKLKEQDQANMLEKYVSECIIKQDPSFFPIIDSELKQQFQQGFINK